MPQGGGTRLGGEFQAGEYSTVGRYLFLQAFAQRHQKAVKALQQLAEDGGHDEAVDEFCEKYWLWCIPLDQWRGANKQASSDWLRLSVWDTVQMWRRSAWARKDADWFVRRFSITTGDGSTGTGSPVEPGMEGLYRLAQSVTWDPTEKTEAKFRADVEEYIEWRKEEYREAGLPLSPIRRDMKRAYVWVVLFHVDRVTFQDIAESANKDIDTVRKAVNRVRLEIGLPRLPRGRRRR